MATLKQRRGKWCARVRWYENGEQQEEQVSLRTESRTVALERLYEVNKVQSDIKSGLEYDFPWLSNVSRTKVKHFTLKNAADQWIKERQNRCRPNTLTTNKQGLDYFLRFNGKTRSLDSINNKSISLYISYLEKLRLSDTSINIHLRTIKAMFNYYLKLDVINKMPLIEQRRIHKRDPIYITEGEFESIMKLEWLDIFYKNVFLLYRDTGMRLREPFMASLNGEWIDIPPESKSHSGRSIELSNELQSIFTNLKFWLDKGAGSELKDPGGHFSKKFKKALIEIGADSSKKFHSLRHTYAVRSLIKEVPIYNVSLNMGHSSVDTTEHYAKMNRKRAAQDFPSLRNSSKREMRDTRLRDTKGSYEVLATEVTKIAHASGA